MSRGKMGVFTSVAAVALMFGPAPVSAAHHLIGAVDNIAPEAPTSIDAIGDVGVPSIEVSWDLSPSDQPGVTSTGNATQATGANIVASNDVESYIIRVSESGGELVEVARVPAGTTIYVDETVLSGPSYVYEVSAFDGTNESDAIASFPVTLGDAPSASVAPSGLIALGVVDGTASESVIVSNGGPGILSVGLQFDPTSGFVASFLEDLTSTIGAAERFEVAADDELQLFVGFDAALVGNINADFTGIIAITTNDPENRRFELEFTATIEAGIDAPDIRVAPPAIAYGGVLPGSTTTKIIDIHNDGGQDLTIDVMIASVAAQSDGAQFHIDDGSTPIASQTSIKRTVLPGDSTPFAFTFVAKEFGSGDDSEAGSYSETVTIESNDPLNPIVNVQLRAVVRPSGDGAKPVTAKVIQRVIKAKSVLDAVLDFADDTAVEQFKEKFKVKTLAAIEKALGTLPEGFTIRIISITEGSVVVEYEIVEPEPDETGEEPVITAADGLAALIEAVDDPGEDVFEELGTSLSIADETEDVEVVVSLQPTDANGDDIVGWFTRTGTRVDLDDFFAFADAFGSTVDTVDLDVFDIAGPDQGPADGVINFEDFFRFADDFGKEVANAAEIQEILGT